MTWRVEFLGSGKAARVEDGTSVLEAAFDAGVPIATACAGQGTCGRCQVRLVSGEVRQREAGAHARKLEGDARLACLTTVHSDARVEILGRGAGDEQAIVGAVKIRNVRDLHPAVRLEPPVKRYVVKLDPPSVADPTPDLARLVRALGPTCDTTDMRVHPGVVGTLAETLRANDFEVAVTMLVDGCAPTVTSVGPASTAARPLALAIDIGTTTVVVTLMDSETGDVLAETSDYNGQHSFGEDVVSRIVFSMKKHGLHRLSDAVIGTVDRLVAQALTAANVSGSLVTHAIVAGNTTMIHLLYGLTPRYIREEPYVPTVSELPWQRASSLGLLAVPNAMVWAVPAVASWVGGDILAGILASGTAERDELELYLDIGTNGEIVLGNKDWLLCCSCSAGPAFEGGGVRDGMRAAPGAIEGVYIASKDSDPELTTIAGAPPRGICGSGLMDLVAEMFLVGLVGPDGKLCTLEDCRHVRRDPSGIWEYVVVGENASATGEAIVLTEPDLDNLIRAKAAIYAAMSLLAESVGLTLDAVERFTIAGGFGNKIKIRKAIDIGLMPDLPAERFDFFGNGAIKGALLCAASLEELRTARDLVHRMSYVELSVSPDFMERYVSAMFLPHTEGERFPSVAAAVAERRGQ
jgi:uncharacterized 2Fe-2S/4Fe-4S cluster protein (DUF4445 family)